MSLDVTLYSAPQEKKCTCSCCGNEHTTVEREELFQRNITHNLGKMAGAAGIYKCVWRPDENGITMAKQLIEPLTKAIDDLRARPEYFAQFDAANGWGRYEHFVLFVDQYLDACLQFPDAAIEVSS